jgi:coiled-coil domain-containing protein 130
VTTGNKLAGKHPLGSRARNLASTGALTVRFEMPFAVWCTTCSPKSNNVLIGQGVRFNAEKKKVGNYYSTPIFSFRMKHIACGGWIEIRTDPKNTAYIVTEGGRRRDTGVEEEGGSLVGSEIRVGIPGEEDPAKKDAFAKLEGKVEDKRKLLSESGRVLELQKRQARDWEDPYEQSKKLRKVFRAERKSREKDEKTTEGLKEKMSLGIDLVAETEQDRLRAGMVDFGDSDTTSLVSIAQSKPMFRSKTPPLQHRGTGSTKYKDRGKRGRKSKPADIAAERKALLRDHLSGNTRAVIDPFLTHEKVWKPDLTKRRKIEKSTSTPSSGRSNDDAHDDERNGLTSINKTANGESADAPTALVPYDSDSD